MLPLALGVIGYLIALAGLRDLPGQPVAYDQLLAVVAAANLLLVSVAVIFKPGGGSSLVKVSWSLALSSGSSRPSRRSPRWPGRRCAPSRAAAHRN